MTKLILFSGPKRCGKDTAATVIARAISDVGHIKLSHPLKEIAAALTGFSVDALEHQKDTDILAFGMTSRNLQIMAFQAIAAKLGEDWLGQLMWTRMQRGDHDWYVCSDGGRDAEIVPLAEQLGPHDLHIVQIIRPGCDYGNDIRHYISSPDATVHTIANDGTQDQFEEAVLQLATDILLLEQ